MKPLVYLHADESCLGNQFRDRASPGGAAGLIEYWRDDTWVRRDYWLSEPGTTNNRMALRGAIAGLELLRRPCRVRFFSDSQYLVRGMEEWLPRWIEQGWRRRSGPIENEDLWRSLVEAKKRHTTKWQWVRGHAGHPHNEYANYLAIRAAKQQDASPGLVASGFLAWLEAQRERYQRYLDLNEWAPPGPDGG